jgi:hypothetical protein
MAAALAIIADDRPRRYHRPAFGVAINLTHAKVAREKPPAPVEAPPIAPPPAVDAPQPADVVLIQGNTRNFEPFRIVEDYDALCEAFADRVEDLEVTRLGVDAAGGFAGGHASTLLCNPQIKNYGPKSLTRMLEATGLVIVLAIDDERFAKVKDKLIRRERPLRPAARKLAPPTA